MTADERRRQRPPTWLRVALGVSLPLLSACSGATGPSRPPLSQLTIAKSDQGTTKYVQVGAVIEIHLRYGTYANLASAKPSVIRAAPLTRSQANPCLADTDCDIWNASLTAAAPGTTVLSATLVACPQLAACPPGQNPFTVTIVVRPRSPGA
jgi:hypothetical protein